MHKKPPALIRQEVLFCLFLSNHSPFFRFILQLQITNIPRIIGVQTKNGKKENLSQFFSIFVEIHQTYPL